MKGGVNGDGNQDEHLFVQDDGRTELKTGNSIF